MNERTKRIMELIRYSVKVEMTLPGHCYPDKEYPENGWMHHNIEIIKQLMDDDQVKVELVHGPEGTNVIVEMVQ